MTSGAPDTPAARLVLRDGSTAGVRPAQGSDSASLRRFFDHLSPESLRLRLLGSVAVSDALIAQMCDNADPERALTLVAWRLDGNDVEVVGVGSYFATSPINAEAAFAVADRFHGRGIGTALLERLAAHGAAQGFESFSASVLPDNTDMLDVFRNSGFEVRSATSQGNIEIRLSLQASAASIAAAAERDRVATIASLGAILRPRAVAVVGASRRPTNLGRRVFDALVDGGFTGQIFPVNPAAGEVRGLRAYASARDLPAGVDLAVIAVPRDAVLGVVDECAAAGVKGIVVISAGFAETDARGRELQAALVERVRGHGMRMLGPNCMGVINSDPATRLNASFAERLPQPGGIAMASQSGGLGLAVLQLAAARHMGLSTFVSLGNKADISGNDILQYAESDPATSVILLYLESFGNPRRFGQIAKRVARTKPIVVVKSGRTPAGHRAAASHTAGLAASELTVDGLFHQSGVIRADTIDEMFDIAAYLHSQPLPRGSRVAIVTNAGGPGILAADACTASGLDVTPTAGGLTNPLDLIASAGADAYRGAVEQLIGADDVDAVFAIYTTIDPDRSEAMLTAIAEGIAAGRRNSVRPKPVVVCTMASPATRPLCANGESIPVYAFPEQAAFALGKATAYARWLAAAPGAYRPPKRGRIRAARDLCRDVARARGETWLTPAELHHLLTAVDLRPAPGVLAHSADEAADLARVFGFPVVAKLSSPAVVHKTDVGGVRLHLSTDSHVRAAYEDLAAIARDQLDGQLDGVLIQPMMTSGVEVFAGLSQDPTFGPLVAFGMGGIHVELFRDVSFRAAPLTDLEADALLHGVRGFALLDGYRNRPRADVAALRDLLLTLSDLGTEVPELVELEFNPLMAQPLGRGYQIVDARAKVRGAPPAR